MTFFNANDICKGGPISGLDFFWYLIREHKEQIEQYIMDYLHYVPDNSKATGWNDACFIQSAKKYNVIKRKNRMLRVHFSWSGRINFKAAHAGGGCPLRGYTVTGEPIPGYRWRYDDNFITFYLFNEKKYYPGNTSLCSQCVNQLKCAVAGKPAGSIYETYFSPIENQKKVKNAKRSKVSSG